MRHNISTDRRLNPELRAQVSEVRGGLVAQAHTQELPARFVETPLEDRPAVRLLDTATGRELEVPLCDLYGVRRALAYFFQE